MAPAPWAAVAVNRFGYYFKVTKIALITGANGGIGQALCHAFLDKSYTVLATDIMECRPPCHQFLKLDLDRFCTDDSYRVDFFKEVREIMGSKGLHALVNNAATQIISNIESVTVDDWRLSLHINLVAPFLLAQGFLVELVKARGSIINIASIHSKLTKPRFVCYATTKAALTGLTRSLAVELGEKGVRINAIAPAATDTKMLWAGFSRTKQEIRDLSDLHPIRRIAQPEEIASVALFLASDQASFINGVCLDVDGGIGARLHDPD